MCVCVCVSQGRARPSIAKLYSWRYNDLGDLPIVQQEPQFLQANPGFAFDYQFINVPDFMGKVRDSWGCMQSHMACTYSAVSFAPHKSADCVLVCFWACIHLCACLCPGKHMCVCVCTQGEMEPSPYYIQNLGEAEYVVAIYSFMRLMGYPAEKISILTTYNGQKDLIKDVVRRRCASHPLLGQPAKVRAHTHPHTPTGTRAYMTRTNLGLRV